MQILRNKLRPSGPLNFVRARLDRFPFFGLGDDRRIGRLDGDGFEIGIALLDHPRHAGDGPAGADGGDDRIDVAVGVAPDFLGSCRFMNVGIGGIVELRGDDGVGILLMELGAFADGAGHAFGAGGKHKVGSQDAKQPAAFNGHRFRHGEGELIPLGSADEGERDAGVARGRFVDVGFLVNLPRLFACLDHGDADAVLDRAEGIEEFALGEHGRAAFGDDAVDFDEGGVAHGFGDVGVDSGHIDLLLNE